MEKRNLERIFRADLERIQKQTGRGAWLDPRIWQSAVSSGKLMLFNLEELLKLQIVYNFVEGIEYEATRLGDTKEYYERLKTPESFALFLSHSGRQMKKEKQLKESIQNLLDDEEFWH